MSLHRQLLVLPIKEQQVCDKLKGLTPVKDIIDHRHNKAYDEYFLRSPVETHTKEELDAVHRAILYTHLFKREESMRKNCYIVLCLRSVFLLNLIKENEINSY